MAYSPAFTLPRASQANRDAGASSGRVTGAIGPKDRGSAEKPWVTIVVMGPLHRRRGLVCIPGKVRSPVTIAWGPACFLSPVATGEAITVIG